MTFNIVDIESFTWYLATKYMRVIRKNVNMDVDGSGGLAVPAEFEGTIFWNYKHGEKSLTEDEVRFWIESAKKEYFFLNDRAIKYETSEV